MTVNVEKINKLNLALNPEDILALKTVRRIFEDLYDVDENESGEWDDTELEVSPEMFGSVEDINSIISQVDNLSWGSKDLFER